MIRSFKPTNSSIISEVRYNDDNSALYIAFHTGLVYRYADVSLSRYVHFRDAESAGSYFNNRIKPTYPAVNLPYGFPKATNKAATA